MIFRTVPSVDGVVEPSGRRLEEDDRRPGPKRDLLRGDAVEEEVPASRRVTEGCTASRGHPPDRLRDVVSASSPVTVTLSPSGG